MKPTNGRNVVVVGTKFKFTPPAGVDVVGE